MVRSVHVFTPGLRLLVLIPISGLLHLYLLAYDLFELGRHRGCLGYRLAQCFLGEASQFDHQRTAGGARQCGKSIYVVGVDGPFAVDPFADIRFGETEVFSNLTLPYLVRLMYFLYSVANAKANADISRKSFGLAILKS